MNKITLITGAGRGIGFGIAKKFAENDNDLIETKDEEPPPGPFNRKEYDPKDNPYSFTIHLRKIPNNCLRNRKGYQFFNIDDKG